MLDLGVACVWLVRVGVRLCWGLPDPSWPDEPRIIWSWFVLVLGFRFDALAFCSVGGCAALSWLTFFFKKNEYIWNETWSCGNRGNNGCISHLKAHQAHKKINLCTRESQRSRNACEPNMIMLCGLIAAACKLLTVVQVNTQCRMLYTLWLQRGSY